jgi:hypothetical protein
LPRKSKKAHPQSLLAFAAVFAAVFTVSAAALWWFWQKGYLLYYGDAQAHVNIARRILDSRTPGPEQIGTVWLPLPHLAALPLVSNMDLWASGLAGAIPSAVAFVLGCCFLFAAGRRIFASDAAAALPVALLLTNPNVLYLQSIPMTEMLQFGCVAGLLWGLVTYQQAHSMPALAIAAIGALAGTQIRYEGWFLLPFAVLIVLVTGRNFRHTLLFAGVTALGPLSWLAHNLWYYGDPLEFYHGPYSAKTQNPPGYPGYHNWADALRYYWEAAYQNAGLVVTAFAALGLAALLFRIRRHAWILFFLLIPAFYVWSIHGSGTPIFVPGLPPHSYYNVRYGITLMPFLVMSAGALLSILPEKSRGWLAVLAGLVSLIPWLLYPSAGNWISFKESLVNSEARRAWTQEAADFLAPRYRPGSGVLCGFGDQTAIFARARIALREVLHDGNGPAYYGAIANPDAFLNEEWAIVRGGDSISLAMRRARRPEYVCVKTIAIPGQPAVEIYHREGSRIRYEHPLRDSLRKSARRAQ